MKKVLIFLFSLSLLLTISGCQNEEPKKTKEQENTFEKEEIKPITVGNGIIAVSTSDIKANQNWQNYVNYAIKKLIVKEKYNYKLLEAEEYANNYFKQLEETYPDSDELKNIIYNYYNTSSIESFKNILTINYLYNFYIEEKVANTITEKEIKNYYETKIRGDILVRHILLDNESEIANIINTLDNCDNKKETFISLASKFSIDKETAKDGGSLGYINEFDFTSKELLEEAYKLKKGEYTKVKTEFGYHIIYVEDIKTKENYNNLKDKITKRLAEEKLSLDNSLASEITKKELDNHKIWQVINKLDTILIDTTNFILYDKEGKVLTEYLEEESN